MVWIRLYTGKHNTFLHVGFWAMWVLFFTLLQSLGQGSSSLLMWLWYYLITLPVFVIHTYLIAYWLVPAAFLKRKYGWFVAGLAFLLVVFSILELVLSNEFIFKWENVALTADYEYLAPGNIIISGIGNHYIVLVFMAIKVGKAWLHSRTIEEEEKQRKLETNLETYNYQFRPRVIYNLMLLLGHAIQNDMKKSSEHIIRISGFLSAFLNEKNMKHGNLSGEIKLLEMYLDNFSAALPGRIRTELTTEGNFSSLSATCYLFLPVVDYALSLGKCCNNSCSCSVFLKEENEHLYFYMCLNSEKKIDQQNGIDSEMLERRLKKNFPGKVSLRQEKANKFWKLEADVFFQKM